MKGPLLLAFVATLLFARPALGDDLSYDDAAMHYRAPAGWERVPLGDAAGSDEAPAAVFALRSHGIVARTVTIVIAPYDGALADFFTQKQSALRQGASETSAVFFEKKELTKLTNGMPAEYLIYTLSSDKAPPIKNYEYLWIDGARSIDVTLSAEAADISDSDATTVLSSLYGVAYPHRHAEQ